MCGQSRPPSRGTTSRPPVWQEWEFPGFDRNRFYVAAGPVFGFGAGEQASVFKDQDGVVSGLVDVGGHEPTLRRLIAEFGPFLEAAKSRDVAVLTGFRF